MVDALEMRTMVHNKGERQLTHVNLGEDCFADTATQLVKGLRLDAGPFMMSRLGRHRPPIRIRYTLKIIGLQAEKDACEPDRNCIKLQYIATVEVSHEQ